MGTKHDNGCHRQAMDDEPIFTILARDPCGPDTIRHWVMQRQALIGRGEKPQDDNSVMAEALATAQDMVVWREDATDPGKGFHRGSYRWQMARVAQDTNDVVKQDHIERLHADNTTMAETLNRYENLLRLSRSKFAHYRDEHLKKCTQSSDEKAQVNHNMVSQITAALTGMTTPPMERNWTSRIENRDMPIGGYPVNWDEVEMVWEFGNRFRLWADEDNKWWIAEKETALAPTEWTGKYPLQHSLQADMLKAAYNDWHTRETARPFLTIEGGPRIREIRLGVTIQKMSTGIRQVTEEIMEWADGKQGDRVVWLTNLMDRLNGYAAEMRDDVNNLSSEFPATEQSAAEAIHQVMEDHPEEVVAAIRATGDETKKVLSFEETRAILGDDAAIRSTRSSAVFGAPYSGGIVTGDPYQIFATEMKKAMTETPTVDEGETVRTMTEEETTLHRTRLQEGVSSVLAEVWAESLPKAESDTLDVTDTPEMPPHRFTMFSKAKGWAYGRGLEIAPAHIPDMLDRMADDGWNLQCVFGGVEPTKVGMLFKRAPRVRWLGETTDRPVYPDWSPEARAAMRTDINNPEVKLDHKVERGQLGVAMFRGHMITVPKAMPVEDRRAVKNLLLCGDPTGCTDLGQGQEP